MSLICKPLDGVVVVAVEQAVAAPFATRQLADLGARVIKVERRDSGDFARGYDETVHGLSSAFLWLNRGKESLALNLKHTEGRTILDKMLAKCDVFVHNVSPAAARRSGLDSTTLQSRWQHLIPCAISGYGETGPLADAKAYDLLVQGETGIISLTGDGDHLAKVGISIADISAGTYAFSSILAALFHRERASEALPVNISLFDSLSEWLAHPLYYTRYGGRAPLRLGTRHATIAPYAAFKTQDGQQLLIAVQNDREWQRFCEVVLGDAEMAHDPRFLTHRQRIENRGDLETNIARRFSTLNLPSAQSLLAQADIAYARLNDIADLAQHEQLVTRGRWVGTHSPVGEVETLLPPWLPDSSGAAFGAVPELGEHTTDVLRWLGYDTDAIDRLRDDQII